MPLPRLEPAPGHQIIIGDVLEGLREIPDGTVQCAVTSPPYYGLRDYGTGTWEGGDPQCDHKSGRFERGGLSEKQSSNSGSGGDEAVRECPKCGAKRIDQQIGLEATPEEYIAKLVAVFREVRRVLRDDGTCFVNMGDSYAGSGRGAWNREDIQKEVYVPGIHGQQMDVSVPMGMKPKDLMLMPFRLAIALQADGWFIRDIIVWWKPNPMPSSVQDRCTSSWEPIIMMAKSAKYFADMVAVGEPWTCDRDDMRSKGIRTGLAYLGQNFDNSEKGAEFGEGKRVNGNVPEIRNLRNVWQFSTQPTPDAHFATFPEELPSRCIRIGTSEYGACPQCGAPWERIIERNRIATRPGEETKVTGDTMTDGNRDPQRHVTQLKTIGSRATCQCNADGDPVPQIILDPFSGSGTSQKCARILGRHSIGCELNEKYAREIAMAKIADAFEDKRRPKIKQAVGQKSIFDE